MMESYDSPIKEPYAPLHPILDPLITEIEYQLAFPEKQREWIKKRDNGECQMPVIDENGNFVSYANDKTPLTVHHILPVYYWKHFRPEAHQRNEQDNPLNGITLGQFSHNILHRDWIQSYQWEYKQLLPQEKNKLSFEMYVTGQTSKGRPAWLTNYDNYFKMIATLNSYDHMIESAVFPFHPKYKTEIEVKYNHILQTYPDFVESYYQNRGW